MKSWKRKDVNTVAVDPQFGVDHYNRAKVLTESETIVQNILTLLFGKPGFYPSIPRLGMNIQQYLYSFTDELDVNHIKTQLASQCRDFLDVIADGSFDVIKSTHNDQPLLIFVIPTKLTNTTNNLFLGITVNSNGEYQFNFVFDTDQYI